MKRIILLLALVMFTDIGLGMSESELYSYATKRMAYIKTTRGTGSGFIVDLNGEKILYTCEHCVMGSDVVSATTFDGTPIKLGIFQVATNRDLVRFSVDGNLSGFKVASDEKISFGLTINAVGDSQGEGVMTMTPGKILAAGVDKIEIDAGVQPGNSGGPVINREGEVVGVVSYGSFRHNEMTKGTRFDKTRRFAEKLKGARWMFVSFNKYYADWVKMKDSLRLALFMAKWDESVWQLFLEGKYSRTAIEDERHALSSAFNPAVCKRFVSMCSFLQKGQNNGDYIVNNANSNSFIIKAIFAGRLAFPAELLGEQCESVDDYIMKSGGQASLLKDFFYMWKQTWYWRCVLECESSIKFLEGLNASYAGERDIALQKIREEIKPLFEKQYEKLRKSDNGRCLRLGIEEKPCPPFGEGDDQLPENPFVRQMRGGNFFPERK